MRRILLIAVMLLPLSQAMAAVTITAVIESYEVVDGNQQAHMRLDYSSDADVRAFALDINSDNGTNMGDTITNFLRGESIDPSIVPGKAKGYGIFPGRFRDFINPSVPDWDDLNYMPVTPWAAPGAENTGLGWPKMVVEMGTLWATGSGDINKPATSGTLFKFDVNSEGAGDCNLTVALNALRGGVVGGDANPLATNLPVTIPIDFPSACTVPDCVGQTRAACLALLAGCTPAQTPVDNNVAGTGQALRQVIAQNPAAGVACTGSVTINVVSYPIVQTSPIYVNWQAHNRPQCWAYPRNCRGDIDGVQTGQAWVSSADLNLFKTAFNKAESAMPANGYCGDIDRVLTGQAWVSSADLNLFKTAFNDAESLVPTCGTPPDTNYWFWCAPGGVCPNSP